MYAAIFSAVMAATILRVVAIGDTREVLGAMVLLLQAIISGMVFRATGGALLPIALVYLIAGFTYVITAKRKQGMAFGILSLLIVITFRAGYLGIIPTWQGGGAASWTVWNITAWLAYGQIIVLWRAVDGIHLAHSRR